MCNLSIQKLDVVNFRKFENKSFELDPHMNVFAGKNGSGNADPAGSGHRCGQRDAEWNPAARERTGLGTGKAGKLRKTVKISVFSKEK